jgi:glutathione S-transferase
MIVYGSNVSPYVRKTLAYVAEKGLQAENQPTNPFARDPEFLKISPFSKIPAFRDGDFAICDSTAIITYLEAKHPEPPLLPADPKSRARAVWFEEFADTILITAMGKIFTNRLVAPRFLGRPGDEAVAAAAEKDELPPILDYIERTLPDAGFLVEDRLTLADLAVASPFVNLLLLGIRPEPERLPKTRAYVDRMLARPSFAPLVAAVMPLALTPA